MLEEYTGHTCINCPLAHQQAQALHNLYGEQLIVVAIHAGSFAATQVHGNGSYSYDWTTPVGNAIFNLFIPSNQPFPTGNVQRKRNSTGIYPTAYSAWGSYIAPLVIEKPSAKLYLTNTYDAAARTITTRVNTGFIKDITDSLSLSVLYTEDSIVNWQKNGQNDVPDYVHRHALRGSLNGSLGSYLGNVFAKDHGLTKTYTSTALKADIRPEQVSVVAILYNPATKVVLQVAEKKLLP